jgi:hypothetical protein
MKPQGFFAKKKKKWLRRLMPLRNRLCLSWRWSLRRFHPPEVYSGKPDLIVSLTSYPPRFATLHLTVKSLLLQRLKPTRLILWIAYDDAERLPQKVLALQQDGLEIRYCEDLKSYKKIIPALESFSEAIIVTADDDVYYWPDWLAELVAAWRQHPQDVIAHRLRRIGFEGDRVRPYKEWTLEVTDQLASPANFATGIGGVLYPPGCFHPTVLEREKFMQLCPEADDVWLYWMVRLNGRIERHSGTKHRIYPWRGSQSVSLWKKNRNLNDEQIARMISAFGCPWMD